MAGCEVAVRPGKGVMWRSTQDRQLRGQPLPHDGDATSWCPPQRERDRTTDTPSRIRTTSTPRRRRCLDDGAGDVLLPASAVSALRVCRARRSSPRPPPWVTTRGEPFHSVIRHAQRMLWRSDLDRGRQADDFRLMARTPSMRMRGAGVERSCTTAETRCPGARPQLLPVADHQRTSRRAADNPWSANASWCHRPTYWRRTAHPKVRSTICAGPPHRHGPCQVASAPSGRRPPPRPREYDRAEANAALRAFVQERWKGQRPVLWVSSSVRRDSTRGSSKGARHRAPAHMRRRPEEMR